MDVIEQLMIKSLKHNYSEFVKKYGYDRANELLDMAFGSLWKEHQEMIWQWYDTDKSNAPIIADIKDCEFPPTNKKNNYLRSVVHKYDDLYKFDANESIYNLALRMEDAHWLELKEAIKHPDGKLNLFEEHELSLQQQAHQSQCDDGLL
jgi:hypothetical protein